MKSKAIKQLQRIDDSLINEILANHESKRINSMVIDFDSVERIDLVSLSIELTKAERELRILTFPMFSNLTTKVNNLKLSSKYQEFLSKESLSEIHKTPYEERTAINHFGVDFFDFQLDIIESKVAVNQREYYFPHLVNIENCTECQGDKYVTCRNPLCEGSHYVDCPECHGNRTVNCKICSGDGEVPCGKCYGSGSVTCGSGTAQTLYRFIADKNSLSGCNGTGVDTRNDRCRRCAGSGKVTCKQCNHRGTVKCNNCDGSGQVGCRRCNASGKIECSDCYGDSKRFGKIDCPICHTAGVMGEITYVETKVIKNTITNIINIEKLPIKEADIARHVKEP